MCWEWKIVSKSEAWKTRTKWPWTMEAITHVFPTKRQRTDHCDAAENAATLSNHLNSKYVLYVFLFKKPMGPYIYKPYNTLSKKWKTKTREQIRGCTSCRTPDGELWPSPAVDKPLGKSQDFFISKTISPTQKSWKMASFRKQIRIYDDIHSLYEYHDTCIYIYTYTFASYIDYFLSV